jgi:hypothetical protein
VILKFTFLTKYYYVVRCGTKLCSENLREQRDCLAVWKTRAGEDSIKQIECEDVCWTHLAEDGGQ